MRKVIPEHPAQALTMIIPLAWRIGQDNLHATERRIVCPLAFLSKAVPDIVRVTFIKLRKKEETKSVNTVMASVPARIKLRDSVIMDMHNLCISWVSVTQM